MSTEEPNQKRANSKPALLPSMLVQLEAPAPTKSPSSAKLIRDAQKESKKEALTMTDEQLAALAAKGKKGSKADDADVDPATFKFNLDDKNKKAFLQSLTQQQRDALPPHIKSNVDYLVNVPLPRQERAQSGYFLFGAVVREQMKAAGEKLAVAEVANRIKTQWEKLGESGQAKYEKMREVELARVAESAEKRPLLIEAMKKALEFYSKALGKTVNDPATLSADDADHGVEWTTHFKDAHMKKIINGTPGWNTAVTKDVSRVVAAASEAFVVWVGQQLAVRVVKAGKKTVSGPFLKAFSLEDPHRVFMAKLPHILALDGDKEKVSKDKVEKVPKEKKEKVAKKESNEGALKAFVTKDKTVSTAFDESEYDLTVKSKKEKSKKDNSRGPLTVPTDLQGVSPAELSALQKEAKSYENIVVVNAADGSVSYHQGNADGDLVGAELVQKFLAFKTTLAKLQSKSDAAKKPTAAQKRKQPSAADDDDMDDDDVVVQSPKKQRQNAKKQ